MPGLEEPLAPPFTPQKGLHTGGPTTPLSGQSHQGYGPSSANACDLRRTSFPASSYRSSAVLETGSAIPLQFSKLDEPREIQIQRARDSIVGMSSVLSDMKSQINTVRRASNSSEPAAAAAQLPEPARVSPTSARADRAARIKALGAPWMPQPGQNQPATHGVPPRGPPPAFKAPLSPLSPPEKIPDPQGRAQGSQGSPLDNDSFTTAEEQVSDEDPHRAMPTLPRLSSTDWRDMLSPSPTRNLDSKPRPSLRQAALGSDDDADDLTPQDYSVMGHPNAANATNAASTHARDESADVSNASAQVYDVDDAVRMRRVEQAPAVREVSVAAPQEAKVRDTRAPSAASIPAHEIIGSGPGVPPVPPRHDHYMPSKAHHRYHSLGSENAHEAPQVYHARTQSQAPPQTKAYAPASEGRPRPASQPTPQAHTRPRVHVRSDSRSRPLPTPAVKPQSQSQSQPQAQVQPQAQARPRPQSQPQFQLQPQPQPQAHSHARAHSASQAQRHHSRAHSQSKSHSDRSGLEDAQRKRNFTKKSITNLVATAPPDHVYDLDEIDLPGPERRLLEKFVNSLSKLSIEIQMDEGKREEGRRRLNNALRALEGWI